MLWNKKLLLGRLEGTVPPYQHERVSWDEQAVFANTLPAHASEYQATQAVGREVSLVFEVRPEEYAGQTRAMHEGKKYNIYRTYPKSEAVVELYLTDKDVVKDAAG